MRYFIISLIINIAILFIPLKSEEILSKKKESISETKVVLNLQKEIKEQEILPQIPEPVVEPEILPEPEPIIEPEPEILPEPIAKPKPEIKKEIKEKPAKPKRPKKERTPPKVEKQPEIPPVPHAEPSTISPTLSHVKDDKNLESEENLKERLCEKNVGFKIVKEPEAEYPKKALLLRLKESFYVEVDFKVIKGEINILSVRGKNKIFNDEAVALTKNMEIRILADDISHCIITKPYEFKIKD